MWHRLHFTDTNLKLFSNFVILRKRPIERPKQWCWFSPRNLVELPDSIQCHDTLVNRYDMYVLGDNWLSGNSTFSVSVLLCMLYFDIKLIWHILEEGRVVFYVLCSSQIVFISSYTFIVSMSLQLQKKWKEFVHFIHNVTYNFLTQIK